MCTIIRETVVAFVRAVIFLRGRRLKSSEVLDHPWVYDPTLTELWWHDFSPDQRRNAAVAKTNALVTTDGAF